MTLLDYTTPQPERRLRRLHISPELILSLLHVPPEGTVIDGVRIKCIQSPIPRTAKPVKAAISDSGEIVLHIEDESFGLVREGYVIPQITPWFEATQEARP